jgi:septum formation protein
MTLVDSPIILASASPRRRELLLAAGLDCEVDPVAVDEQRHPGEAPADYVARVARLKAETGATRRPDRDVLAADTAVVVGDEVLGKPADDRDAARMLGLLSGRAHDVLTGVALARHGRIVVEVESTTVWMASLSDEDVAWYVATGEPRDKAGAYAIQGLASRFIPRIAGSYTNIVGLPVARVYRLLMMGRAGHGGLEDPSNDRSLR